MAANCPAQLAPSSLEALIEEDRRRKVLRARWHHREGGGAPSALPAAAHTRPTTQAVDATKRRAMSQRVDYDTFAKLVSVAHLQPVNGTGAQQQQQRGTAPRKAATGGPAVRFGADGAPLRHTAAPSGGLAVVAASLASAPPSSAAEFQRQWHAAADDVEQRLRLLRRCDEGGTLPRLLRTGLTPALLAELVAALSSAREQGTGAGALGARVLALARAAPGYRVCCSALGRGARAALDALLLDYRGGV